MGKSRIPVLPRKRGSRSKRTRSGRPICSRRWSRGQRPSPRCRTALGSPRSHKRCAHIDSVEDFHRVGLLGGHQRIHLDHILEIQLQLDQRLGSVLGAVRAVRMLGNPVPSAQDLPDGPRRARQSLAF